MVRLLLSLAALAAAPALAQQPTQASVTVGPQARTFFERDWVLMNWALKFYDRDHDILLSQSEAQAAAQAFRSLADTDRNGRITPAEYRAARAAILSR